MAAALGYLYHPVPTITPPHFFFCGSPPANKKRNFCGPQLLKSIQPTTTLAWIVFLGANPQTPWLDFTEI
jgi:hypothetical protein